MHVDFLHSMRYHATHKPVWRNGIRACLKNKSPQGVEGSNLSTGIARPQVSASVHFKLKIPLFCPQKSAKICCRLPVLLSLLLST